MVLISTLENLKLREGDRVVVSLGSGEVEAEVIDAGDPAKLKVKLQDTGLRGLGRARVPCGPGNRGFWVSGRLLRKCTIRKNDALGDASKKTYKTP